MANKRISDLPELAGVDLAEADLFTVVHVNEVDPALKNKKITISGTKTYLDIYYLPRTGGTVSGNVTIESGLTVSGQITAAGITVSNNSTFSGIVVQTNAIVSGTVSGTTLTGTNVQGTNVNAVALTTNTATGTTATFTSGVFQNLSGATITGNNISGVSGVFSELSGVTITGTSVNATTGTFQSLATPILDVSGNLSVASGLTVTSVAQFGSGVRVTGTLSGTTVTGTAAQFSNVTGVSGVFTTRVSGATITGNTALFSNVTGVSGTFTSRISGATITGNNGSFGNLTGISGVFSQFLSGATVTGDTVLASNITGVSGVFTNISGATISGDTAQFSNVTGISGVFTSRLSGTTITGNTAQFANVTGVSGVFTNQISGTTVTGSTGLFSQLTVGTGTFVRVSGTVISGDTGLFTNITGIAGVFTTSVSGLTVIGTTLTGATGTFTYVSGATITGNTINATSGVFNNLQATNLSFTDTTVSGNLTVVGSGFIGSGLSVTGTISGVTVTGTTGRFTSITGATGTFTTQLSGATITGTTVLATTGSFVSLTGTTATGTAANFTSGTFQNLSGATIIGDNISGVSGVFSALSGTTITGTNVNATTGTFTTVTGGRATITSGVFAAGSAAAPSISFSSDPNTGIYSPGADQVAISTNGTGRLFVDNAGRVIAGANTTADLRNGAGVAFTPTLFASTLSGTAGIAAYVNDGTNLRRAGLFVDQDNGIWGLTARWSTGAPAFVINQGLSEYLRITSGGLVGIGTTTPSSLLDLSAGYHSITWNNDDWRLRFRRTDGTYTGGIKHNGFGDMSFWTSDSERARIDSSGRLLVGTSSPGGAGIRNAVPLTGNSGNVLGYSSEGVLQPDVVTARYFHSQAQTASNAGTPYTIANLTHVSIAQSTFNADSTVTNQFGVSVSSNLIGATNNYGIYSNIPSGSGHWNFYANGTADSYFASNNFIWQNGGTTERARIDSSGRLLVGTSAVISVPDGETGVIRSPSFQLAGNAFASTINSIAFFNTSVNGAGCLSFTRSNTSTVGNHALVADGNRLGKVGFSGSDGSKYIEAATITASVDGIPGADDIPGRLIFSTTADNSVTATERLKIAANGLHTINSNAHSGAALSTTAPAKLYVSTGTYTDTSTAAAGTVTHGTIVAFDNPAINSTNATVTYTNASTVYIDGAPTGTGNVTVTNGYSLYINAGQTSIPLGNQTAPSICFGTNINTGLFSPGANTIALTTNGTQRVQIDNLGYQTGTVNALGTGLYQAQQLYRLNAGLAGSNVNTAQNILGVGVTLVGSTVYEFEGIFTFTKTAGTTSHSFGIGFGGTATLNNIYIQSIASSAGSALPTNGTGFLGASTSAATFNCITGISAATVSISIRMKGTVSVNAGGTFIPQYTLSAAPGGAYTTTAGSYFKIAPLGASGSATSIGTWA